MDNVLSGRCFIVFLSTSVGCFAPIKSKNNILTKSLHNATRHRVSANSQRQTLIKRKLQNPLASTREKWLGFVKNMRKMHPSGKVRCHKCRGALIHCYQNVTTRYAMNKKRVLLLLLAFLLAYFAGCGKQVEKPEKIKDVEYTVQEESQVPEELLAKMKEKQKETFQMTYATEGYLYIAKGYGTQKTSGYSIRVTDAYEAAEGIVFSTELLGPGKEEPVLQVETYPYIVVKLKDIGLDVLFQ